MVVPKSFRTFVIAKGERYPAKHKDYERTYISVPSRNS